MARTNPGELAGTGSIRPVTIGELCDKIAERGSRTRFELCGVWRDMLAPWMGGGQKSLNAVHNVLNILLFIRLHAKIGYAIPAPQAGEKAPLKFFQINICIQEKNGLSQANEYWRGK